MKFETLAIHAGQGPDKAHGAVMPPIYQTSTFAFEAFDEPGEFDYTRSGNPTRKALEECLAALEGGIAGFVFATGMAATATMFSHFAAGDHVIVHDDLYGGTYRVLTSVVAEHGVEIDFVNLRDLSAVEAATTPATRAIWIETPTNPLMNLVDLAAVAGYAKPRGIMTICDNTFLSPYFQRPLELGVDVVMHSTTKYINGHSDVVGGALITADPGIAERIGFLQNAMGTAEAPFDCFLVLRGVKTLAVRMEAHDSNALAIARWLEGHPRIASVLHPGLPSHPQHELARRQATGYGGTFSFRLAGGQSEARVFLESLRIFTLAESLGGVESLIEQPFGMTHISMPEDVRRSIGITEDLVRISVGIEHVDDLIADLDQALARI
jgi:cystathionine beta-lyase/cystathionine gamma-synthase